MQIDQDTWEAACLAFDREAKNLLASGNDRPSPLDLQSARRVLEAAIGLTLGPDALSGAVLETYIRRRVVELNFAAEAGDAVVDPHYQVPIEGQVQLVHAVLEQLQDSPGGATARGPAALTAGLSSGRVLKKSKEWLGTWNRDTRGCVKTSAKGGAGRHTMAGKTSILLLSVSLVAPWCAGCQNDAQTGALAGGLIGSAAGAAIGAGVNHNNRGEGALIGGAIGAGVGTLGGYIVGNERDKEKAKQDNTY